MPMLVVLGLALMFVAWMLGQPYLRRKRRERVMARPFPHAWRDIIKRRVPYMRAMPADLQLQLKKHIQVFLAEKEFVGCGGLQVTDDIRVTIAAQACLLILNRPTDYYPKLRQILVYPGAFVVRQADSDEAGVVHEHRQVRLGESWSRGQVILSWHDAAGGAAVPDDAQNVVIHEFAHQLDQESGGANGAPPLAGRARRERWSRVMSEHFDLLQSQADRGEPSLFDHYGATDPAEFFAVASETFFEQPRQLAQHYPALYQALCDFYCVDPLSW